MANVARNGLTLPTALIKIALKHFSAACPVCRFALAPVAISPKNALAVQFRSVFKVIQNLALRFSIALALAVSSVAQARLIVVDSARKMQNIASAAPQAAPALPEKPLWAADKGSTLRASLQKWADQARWTLVWDVPEGPNQQLNYPILAPLTFTGSEDQAVAACISLYEQAEKPLAVQIQRAQKLFYVHLKRAKRCAKSTVRSSLRRLRYPLDAKAFSTRAILNKARL